MLVDIQGIAFFPLSSKKKKKKIKMCKAPAYKEH